MPTALLSVSDKTGLVPLAQALAADGFALVSTGGTAALLREHGLTVTEVARITGMPEMLDGRVKTLHPRVHGGILARRSRQDDLAAVAEHDIGLIDLVVVNLYPFAAAAANPETPFDALIEEVDIGGPTLIRAAAKNFEDVLVVVSPADYPSVVEQIRRPGGPARGFRFELARRAFAHTARYDTHIAETLDLFEERDGAFHRGASEPPPLHDPIASVLRLSLRKVRDLRYGENPHQPAALFAAVDRDAAVTLLQGKELSYTNLLDLDAAARIVHEFAEPAAVVVKHTNPCGAATGATVAEAYLLARDADALSAFGGIVAVNRPIDVDAARALVSTKIDAVVAAAVEPDARPVLASKPQMRVVVGGHEDASRHGLELRSILGGVLAQTPDVVQEAHRPWPASPLRVVTARHPTPEEWQALRFAWRICAHVKSNAVVFTSADRTLAIGSGQVSRVDAVRVARMKAESLGPAALAGSVAASDAFFPFRDGLDEVAAAGATAVIQPGGALRDAELIAAADEHRLAMVFTGFRHFRH